MILVPFSAVAQEEAAEGADAAEQEETRSPLLIAIQEGKTSEVRSLLEDGADPNETTEKGMPLLSYAALKGGDAVAEALVEGGADVDAKDKTGATALMYAAQFDRDDIVTALIEAGADVNAADSIGWTPLIRAVIGGNVESVTALMAAGADVNATDFFGRDAARIAQGRDLDEIVAVLSGTAPEAGS
jgi:ankyrin repeat protein